MEVPIHIVGKAPAVETYGGILTHPSTTIMVEALPLAIPNMLEIDVSNLAEIGQTLHASDLVGPGRRDDRLRRRADARASRPAGR